VSPTEKAVTRVYEFWNEADHAAKLAAEARQAISEGNFDRAAEWLEQAERPVRMLEMRLADARKAVGVKP
jgi:hypothetical protein